jgi:hypothetical protein
MQSSNSYLVTGTLMDQQRVLHEVELVIVTPKMPAPGGVEMETISGMKFAQPSPVPDGGPYVLRCARTTEATNAGIGSR